MNLNDLMVYAEVVDAGSFTAAADALEIPKSNVSRNVSRLEESLGVKLLERTTRKLALTEVGRIYYEHCQRIREELESANHSLEKLTSVPSGHLRVCVSVTVGQSLLASHLAGFLQAYPEVTIDLQLTNRRVDLLDEGFDMVIRVGDSPDSSLVSSLLSHSRLQLFASPDYLSSSKDNLSHPEDLLQHSCLFMNALSGKPHWTLSSGQEKQEVLIHPVCASDDFGVLKQLSLDGMGIVKLPDYMVKDEVEAGSLIRVLEPWEGEGINLYALAPSRRGITPKVRAFIDYLKVSL
ncbi:MAG: LysR substrate-binding domain-containing protein [Endozoicomonas sp.]|uniref:LysR substrate-binding domain-containing protein n=1 Tax=Endozoicomonas sp. TaxID=1892382 RepID=UPI003D9B48F5